MHDCSIDTKLHLLSEIPLVQGTMSKRAPFHLGHGVFQSLPGRAQLLPAPREVTARFLQFFVQFDVASALQVFLLYVIAAGAAL